MKKVQIIIITIFLFFWFISTAYAEIILKKASYKTSKQIPLEFVLEKTNYHWDGKLCLWGYVKNNTKKTYDLVCVEFTARDKDSKFLNRKSFYMFPNLINPGEAGSVNGFPICIDLDERNVATLEYIVEGAEII